MPADLMISQGNAALSPLFAWMEALNSPVTQFTAMCENHYKKLCQNVVTFL